MSTLTSVLQLSKPADGATSWGGEIRNAMDTLDRLHGMSNVYWVDPLFTEAAIYPNGVPADKRYHHSIQSAITEAEATGTTGYTTIMVAPGQYNENLTITKTMNIVGFPGGQGLMGYSGAMGKPMLVGAPGSSTITVNVPAGGSADVSFANMVVTHTATGGTGTITGYGQLFYAPDQGTYGAINEFYFRDVNFWVRSNTNTARFESLIKTIGYNNITLDRCITYGNAINNQAYSPKYHFMIQGNTGSNKATLLRLHGTSHNHPSGTQAIIRNNNNGNLLVTRSTFESSRQSSAILSASRSTRK